MMFSPEKADCQALTKQLASTSKWNMEQEPHFNGATYHIVHLLSRIDIGITDLKGAVHELKPKEAKPPIWAQDKLWLAVLGAALLLLAPAGKQDAILRFLMK